MRLLVAEDERALHEIICRHLEREGYRVDSCHNGDEAIAILSYTEYDAVVLDIMMPGADGFSVLRTLRDAGKPVPVLFLPARDAVEDRGKGLDSGADVYKRQRLERVMLYLLKNGPASYAMQRG